MDGGRIEDIDHAIGGKSYSFKPSLIFKGCEWLIEHNKTSALAVLIIVLEAISIVLELFGTSKLKIIVVSFRLSQIGFAINASRSQTQSRIQVTEFVLSQIQLIGTFIHLIILTIKGPGNLIYFTSIFPLVHSVICFVLFTFGKDEKFSNHTSQQVISKENIRAGYNENAYVRRRFSEINVSRRVSSRQNVTNNLSVEEIFSKVLTSNDVENKLSLPMRALQYLSFPVGENSVDLFVKDLDEEKKWEFRCIVQKGSYPRPFLTSGWLEFVRAKDLQIDDKVMFCKLHDKDEDCGAVFAIKAMKSTIILGDEQQILQLYEAS